MHAGPRDPEHQRRVVELRRSNAARPHRSRRAYTRKEKYANAVNSRF